MTPTTLLEPSFAALIAAVEQAVDLPVQTRRHWVCSVRQVAKWLDRPPAEIPRALERNSDVSAQIASRPRWRHRQDLRKSQIQCTGGAPLVRQRARGAPAGGANFAPNGRGSATAWSAPYKVRLYNFIRYCSARGMHPSSINDPIFEDYWIYRTEFTGMASGNATRWSVRAWNACVGRRAKAGRRSRSPSRRTKPASELAAILTITLPVLPSRVGSRERQACSPTTIANRRAELVGGGSDPHGVPIERLTSLAAFLIPPSSKKSSTLIGDEWQGAEEPFALALGWKLFRMARETGCLDHAALKRLDEISATLEQHRHEGLTQKNLQLIQQV